MEPETVGLGRQTVAADLHKQIAELLPSAFRLAKQAGLDLGDLESVITTKSDPLRFASEAIERAFKEKVEQIIERRFRRKEEVKPDELPSEADVRIALDAIRALGTFDEYVSHVKKQEREDAIVCTGKVFLDIGKSIVMVNMALAGAMDRMADKSVAAKTRNALKTWWYELAERWTRDAIEQAKARGERPYVSGIDKAVRRQLLKLRSEAPDNERKRPVPKTVKAIEKARLKGWRGNENSPPRR